MKPINKQLNNYITENIIQKIINSNHQKKIFNYAFDILRTPVFRQIRQINSKIIPVLKHNFNEPLKKLI